MHVPAKFRENTAMRFWVTVRKLNVTDRRTDGQTDGQTDRRTDRRTGGVAISPIPGPTAPAGDNNAKKRYSDTTDYSVHICTEVNIVLHLQPRKLCHFCTELNSDFIVWFILVHFVIATTEMKWWCFRPLLCTLLRLNWAKQTPGIMRRN